MPKSIPAHLKPYVVKQDYSRYTAEDQAVWRYIMRQLKFFLKDYAHPCYIEGLKQTGISTDSIPHIEYMNRKLKRFGWGAVPVSGFIPPAAFMEFQSLGYLPIASELRSIEHIHYTPAPDIVHEAAGHAPIIIDKQFSNYLKKYAEVAAKAIISQSDLNIYDAIRELSDAKERPGATNTEIKKLNLNLENAVKQEGDASEAGLLSRMNWWTAEYGLIGSMHAPKIYGAGLLSSIGEAKECLTNKVKKIPMSVECINYTYDITEPQPQLFVTPDFATLSSALDDLANRMAFKRGGILGLKRAQAAKTVNSIQLDSGIQISGKLTEYIEDKDKVIFMRFSGPTQLCYSSKELKNQGKKYHKEGFSCPVGEYRIMSPILKNKKIEINYKSGVVVSGVLKSILKRKKQLILLKITACTVSLNGKVLYDPSWGPFDLALGTTVTSVFGGAADLAKYGTSDRFVVKKIPKRKYSKEKLRLFAAYKNLRALTRSKSNLHLGKLLTEYKSKWSSQWLLGLGIYEIAYQRQLTEICEDLLNFLRINTPVEYKKLLEDGIHAAALEA